MYKESTPLEALKELKYVHDTECGEDKSINERFALIENALKRLEKIDNATIGVYEEVNKKLKVLDTIKEVLSIEEEDFFYDRETDTYFFIGCKVSKKQFDLLKEELLWAKN